ncbi:hypothetical protein WOLCODRAFT_105111 [Wolfiporia cocos MD-104 SS10]|uniref:Transcription factor IIIC 90kDa subunit N-terminal domain-containing protein n=1 Tax=Wolfiporia cocos (strain MD-104) TaxID=742152 RepID=A0A2H3JQK9_WOLCO|nr:hypothetical protein WOLCODRAFT_105111 [Wolfiporia cocos MD-104 SS10]
MTRPHEISTLSMAAVSAVPSSYCIRWTGDGQLLVLTKTAIYILTPDIAIHIGTPSQIKQALDGRNIPENPATISWFRTMIGFDKTLAHHWPADCQDWGAVSLGSLDPILRAVTPSPSNFTTDAGCLLAVLNSNMELTLWGPVKDHLKGEWIKVLDVTAELRAQYISENESMLVRTLRAQATCIDWSPQAVFDSSPAPQLNSSLLAVGNRAGSVDLLRFVRNREEAVWEIRNAGTVSLNDRCIVCVTWSSWKPSGRETSEALLACGTADGTVVIFKVSQSLRLNTLSGFNAAFELDVTVARQDNGPQASDGPSVTGMKWIDVQGGCAILTMFSPGSIHLWSPTWSSGGWTGFRTIALYAQKVSVGSSKLCLVSGTAYIARKDALVVSLTDGSFHVIHSISTEPSAVPSPFSADLTSEQLSLSSRSAFAEAEPENVTPKDVQRIYGMTSYDHHATYVWLHEAVQPTDFTYKHEAKHVSMLVVAQLLDVEIDDEFLRDLQGRIICANAYTGEYSASLLRPVWLHLRDARTLSKVNQSLLQILQQGPPLEHIVHITVPQYNGELTTGMRRNFKKSLSMHLFGWSPLLSQRLRYVIADFCQKISRDPGIKNSFTQAARDFVATIWHHVLRTLLRHVGAVIELLSPADIPFVIRVIVQAFHASAPDLAQESTELAHSLRSRFPENNALSDQNLSMNELCPACHASIPLPLQKLGAAVCPNGHVWAQCSITSFLLASPMVRTCIGCGRKAFLPPNHTGNNWLPDDVRRSWLAVDILDATRRCFFCGSNFVTLV